MSYFVEFFEENEKARFRIVDENNNILTEDDLLGVIDLDDEPERQPFTPTIIRKVLGKPYCVVSDDWGELKFVGFDKVQEVIDFVLTKVGPEAKIDINDGEVKWDKAEDETTDEFWDWVARQNLREQSSKGGRATAKRGKKYFAKIGRKGALKRWKNKK